MRYKRYAGLTFTMLVLAVCLVAIFKLNQLTVTGGPMSMGGAWLFLLVWFWSMIGLGLAFWSQYLASRFALITGIASSIGVALFRLASYPVKASRDNASNPVFLTPTQTDYEFMIGFTLVLLLILLFNFTAQHTKFHERVSLGLVCVYVVVPAVLLMK